MANELKSTFLRSKMNKDLDARILPPGEYRDGENIAISRSEGADVGALENILGNKLVSDFGITAIGVETIGMYTDNGNNRIFLFMTNYTDSSSDQLSNRASVDSYCSIIVYDFDDENYEVLVEGSFLNFSKTQPIYGINLLEDLLFWTDDRNQPRRIDILKALDAPATSPNPYYQLEENISVAKYYPFSTPETYEEITVTVKAITTVLNFDGSNLNAAATGLGTIPFVPPVDYPQTKYNTICEIQGDLPNIKLHPGLKFYVKSSTPNGGYGSLDTFTTWPFYNEIKNYPIEWAMQSLHGGAPTPFPWPMYDMNSAPNPPRAEYEEESGYSDRWMSVSKEYASNPNALFRANTPGGPITSKDDTATGATQDLHSLDYQENYLKWFYPNIPFLDTSTGEEWEGEVELVFIVPKLRNKTDRWLPSTYRIRLNDIEQADITTDLAYAPEKGLASQGYHEDGMPAIGLIATSPNAQWLPRNTLGSISGINEAWLANEMVLIAGTTNTVNYLTDYQKSVGLGLLNVTLNPLNGYGIGPKLGPAITTAPGYTIPLRTYAKWYFQPGMKIDCPLFTDPNVTLVIDQIFPNGAFPDNTGPDSNLGTFLISVHGEDRDGNFLTHWVTPDMEEYLYDGSYGGIYLDLSFPNPYYEQNFGGDTFYLDEKFCRLAYRYKFDSGEYSLISPFTQCLFQPKNKGYYLKGKNKWDYDTAGVAFLTVGDAEPTSDIEDVSQTTLNKLYENSLEQVQILIESPVIGVDNIPFNEIGEKLKIESLEIIFNESDSTALKVLKSIPVSDPAITTNATNVFTYTWEGDKPYSTLPAKEVVRVSDKVPIKALAQEIAGNRVIYGNFVNRHSSPEFLNYDIGISRKYTVDDEFTSFSTESYPNHTLKQNRSYQVGIVLSDKYGRQSDVILAPSEISTLEANSQIFSGDTFKAKYLTIEEAVDVLPQGRNITDWVGNSIKILFNDVIPKEIAGLDGYPGLYTDQGGVVNVVVNNGGVGYTAAKNVPTTTLSSLGVGLTVDITETGGIIDGIFINQPGKGYEVGDTVNVNQDGNVSAILEITETSAANPLGWYSYKVVVKQQEQDYYNLYLPQILNGEPLSDPGVSPPYLNRVGVESKFVFSTLGDNINKIPREVNESNQFVDYVTSKTKLFPRVSQFGGEQSTWGIFGVGLSSWGSSTNIKTGNVFNDENADGVVNLGSFNNIYNIDPATPPSYSLLQYILYKQQDNPYITIGTNSPGRSPFLLSYLYSPGGIAGLFYDGAEVNYDGYIETTGVGTTHYSGSSSAISQGAFNSGIGVVETSPFVSKLDIFYETSTSGKINDLNYLIETNADENIPYDLRIENALWTENLDPLYWSLWRINGLPSPVPVAGADPWISKITPQNALGLTIPLADVVSVDMSVVDNLGVDRSNEFLISNNVSGTSTYGIYLDNGQDGGLTYLESPSQAHDFTFTITVETLAEIPTDPNNVKVFNFSRSYTNARPDLSQSGSNPRGGPAPLDPPILKADETGIVWGKIIDPTGMSGPWGTNIAAVNGGMRTWYNTIGGIPGLGLQEDIAQQLKWSIISCINQTDLQDYKNNISFTQGSNGYITNPNPPGNPQQWQNEQAIQVDTPLPAGDYQVVYQIIDANNNDSEGGQIIYEYPTTEGFGPLQFTIDPV